MKEYKYTYDRLPTPENSKLLNLVGTNKKVLEIGCAMGYQTRSMREIQNCNVIAIEIDRNAAEHAKPYCDELYIGNIETIDLENTLDNNKFDVITFADVLEHLYNPVETLIKVKPLLTDGGYIVASIPNIAHCSIIYELSRGKFEYRNIGLLDDTHIRFFTKQSIFETFEKAGYLLTSIDRNISKPAYTEFQTHPITQEDENFLKYIYERNREGDTYQFIIKAIPMHDTTAIQSELIKIQNNLNQLTLDLELNKKELEKTQSELTWLTNRQPYKFISRIKQIFKS